MIISMTGFGRSSGSVGSSLQVAVAARSVNHRYLELTVRLPEFLWEMESPIRALAGENFSRGKIDLTIRAQRIGDAPARISINRSVAETVIPQLAEVVTSLGLTSNMTVSDLMRIPDFIRTETEELELDDNERRQLLELVGLAFEQLRTMRVTEGVALRLDIEQRLDTISRLREEIDAARPIIQEETLAAYRERVAELARSSGIEIDHDRLAQETVIMVEKSDVAEEVTRMESHITQMRRLLERPEPAGKKLDFLCQELLREINTLGTKSRSAAIRSVVVELKAELERIREQVQNVE